MTEYELDYAIRMLRQAIDFAEAEGDFTHARRWTNRVERSVKSELDAAYAPVNRPPEMGSSAAPAGDPHAAAVYTAACAVSTHVTDPRTPDEREWDDLVDDEARTHESVRPR